MIRKRAAKEEKKMLAEQDNCGTDLPNKTKVGLQGEVFCV